MVTAQECRRSVGASLHTFACAGLQFNLQAGGFFLPGDHPPRGSGRNRLADGLAEKEVRTWLSSS